MAGQFFAADKDTIKQRKIITAKRRSTPSTVSSGTGLFSSFSGFGSAAPSASGNSKTVGFALPPNKPFLFGAGSSGTTSSNTTTTSSADSKSAEMPSYTSAVSSSSNGTQPTTTSPIPTLSTVSATSTDKNIDNQDPEFNSNLKKLNQSVLNWIEKHVAEDPYCILSPIFIDYNDHLNAIKKNKSDNSNVETSTLDSNRHNNGSATNSSTDSTSVTCSINTPATTSLTSISTTPFGSASTATATTTTSSPWPISSYSDSIFSSSNTTKSSVFGSTGFGFQTSDTKSAFSFASDIAKKAAKPADEEEEYEPPKPENKEIKEEGSVYTKRCKLFYEKDKNWMDKGIANLHVKPLKDKAQLIVRADTNLGNILLNINLLPSMQLKRQGKNNVSLVCIPNPPVSKDTQNKLIPMLLRVKSGEEADELLEVLNKHKCGTDGEAAE